MKKMEEKNADNLERFEQALNASPTPRPGDDKTGPYSVNASAETVVNVLAIVTLIGGIIGCIALFIAGSDMTHGGEAMVIGGIALLVIAVLQWAFLRILVNISRNLFNINSFLRSREK